MGPGRRDHHDRVNLRGGGEWRKTPSAVIIARSNRSGSKFMQSVLILLITEGRAVSADGEPCWNLHGHHRSLCATPQKPLNAKRGADRLAEQRTQLGCYNSN